MITAGASVQAPAVWTSVQKEPFPLYRTTLPNGLQVWTQPRSDSESIATLLVIRAGSRYEDRTNNGISHFVEHMVFTGTERWSEEEIKDVIDNRGGRWNGSTGLERTTYYAHVAAEDMSIALDWLSEVAFHATFPDDKVDKEREVIFQERWGRYGWLINTLDALGFGYELGRDIRRALYPSTSLGMNVIGEDDSLEALDRTDLMNYYKLHYTPENSTLIVVGNVTPDEVLAGAEASFGDLESGARPPAPETPVMPERGPQEIIVRGPMITDQVELVMGARTVGRFHPDRWPLLVLAEVLGEELMEEIRYRQGLVYSVGAYNSLLDDVGYFGVSASSERGNRETIRGTIDEHLARYRLGEVDAEAVAEAKVALKGRRALAIEDNLWRARWLAGWSSELPPGENVPDFQAEIDAVRPEDLSRVVSKYFTPERSFVGLHLPAVTVASGAWGAGAVVILALAAWVTHRAWRWNQMRKGSDEEIS
jgi:predicted Zn-dependent peptidase